MKPAIKDLNEALSYHLEAMYDAEKKLQKAMPELIPMLTSRQLKSELKKYLESSRDKRIKLKRIFSYLLVGPYNKKNKVIEEMLSEVFSILEYTISELNDVLVMVRWQALVQFKISTYSSAKVTADFLDLKKVSDLLAEILAWEKETDHSLSIISLNILCKTSSLALA